MLEADLKEICAVHGVLGSFVCLADGSLAAKLMPEHLDEARLVAAARVVSQTLQALEASRRRAEELDLLFEQNRLIVKNLRGAILVILCTRATSLPLLNLTANSVAKKLAAELKPPKVAVPKPAAPVVTPTPKIAAVETAPTAFFVELEQEAQQVIEAARKSKLTLRPLNSVAVWLRCPKQRARLVPPGIKHLDFVAPSIHRSDIQTPFEQIGYEANNTFNALHGTRRLNFTHPQRNLSADVYFDTFELYHQLNLTASLEREDNALSIAELLLARLQYVQVDDSILSEIGALLAEYDLGMGVRDKIDIATIRQVCADDWGWYKTVLLNLERVTTFAATMFPPAERAIVAERSQQLARQIEDAPKSLRWQMRARLGDTVRWYTTPPDLHPSTLEVLRFYGGKMLSRRSWE